MTPAWGMKVACPLCDRSDAHIAHVANRDALFCECSVCGRFVFTPESLHTLDSADVKGSRYLLSALTRRNTDAGGKPIELLSTTVNPLLESVPRPKTPWDILEPLLLAIHDRTPRDFTEYVWIPYLDYARFAVPSADTLGAYLMQLVGLGLVEVDPHQQRPGFSVHLTLAGWDRVAELRRGGRASRRAFVAMSFAVELEAAWTDGIAPALTEAGWKPIRLDRLEHNDRIDDRIVAEIRRAGMVVADFTGNRPGVYFEAGLALGLGLPVVWTVRESDLGGVHFDTRQYNHIIWKDVADLRVRLKDRVLATIQPPGA